MNRRSAIRRSRSGLALAVFILAGLGCLVSPPLNERPDEPAVMFVFELDAIVPENNRTVLMDRDEEDVIEFGILEVTDQNQGDAIDFQWEFDIDGVLVTTASGQLRIDLSASEERGLTVYEPVLLEVDSCTAELRTARDVTISLLLEQPIPFDQIDPDNPTFAFESIVVWSLRLEGTCPLEIE